MLLERDFFFEEFSKGWDVAFLLGGYIRGQRDVRWGDVDFRVNAGDVARKLIRLAVIYIFLDVINDFLMGLN